MGVGSCEILLRGTRNSPRGVDDCEMFLRGTPDIPRDNLEVFSRGTMDSA
jgi:hypothetical protein